MTRCELGGCYDEAAGAGDYCCPAHRQKAWAGL